MLCVTYNIRYGLGLDGRIDLARIADTVRSADIIALQELDRHWRRTGQSDQPAEIGRMLPTHYWVYGPAFDADASIVGPRGLIDNRRRQFGPMLLSRWPILTSRLIPLPKTHVDDTINMETGAIEALIATPLGTVRVYCLHLSSVGAAERLMQAKCLCDSLSLATQRGAAWTGARAYENGREGELLRQQDWSNGGDPPCVPETVLIFGDFNSEPGEAVNQVMQADCGLVDAWNFGGNDTHSGATWWPDPPDRNPGIPLRIDYCFASPSLAARIDRVWVDNANPHSDHRPLWVEFAQGAPINFP